MAIKTILLHMAPDEARHGRLSAAMRLAERHGAFLEIAYMTKPAHMPAGATGRGASAAYIAEATRIARERAEGIENEVREVCNAGSIDWQFQAVEGDHNQILAEMGHYADLIVVSRDHGLTLEDYVGLHTPDDLLVMATSPVLLLPKQMKPDATIGENVLVAWKDTREAARAVRDSLYLLKQAKEVQVLTSDKPRHRFEESKKLLTYLERHEINANPLSDIHEGRAGEIILSYAEDYKTDMIVMGSYGHSRWREIFWGGTTHHMLKHSPVPLFMAH